MRLGPFQSGSKSVKGVPSDCFLALPNCIRQSFILWKLNAQIVHFIRGTPKLDSILINAQRESAKRLANESEITEFDGLRYSLPRRFKVSSVGCAAAENKEQERLKAIPPHA